MKKTVTIKKLRIVQGPITNCLYAVPSGTNLQFRAFVPIAEQMEAQGEWPNLSVELGDVLENEEQSREVQDTDPLLALAGTLECEVTDVDDTMPPEMRETNAEESREVQVTDPLLKLAGTLECEVTDIGERHDDYIGDALLTELRGDKDE